MKAIAYVDGKYLSMEEASVIHVEDRGYQFGDGVYEVIISYQGKPFAVEEHLDRFFNSMRLLKLKPPYERNELINIISEALIQPEVAGTDHNALIYFQLTRGSSPRTHTFPHNVPGVFSLTVRTMLPFPVVFWEKGVAVKLVEDIRWGKCNIKSLNLLPNVLAKQEAKENNCFEAVLHRHNMITEGASTNIFIVNNGELYTAPLSNEILPGVTRKHICSLARDLGIKVNERSFSIEELYESDEAFLTGTMIEVLSVSEVDRKPIGGGEVGPLTKTLQREYKQWIRQCIGSYDQE